MNSSRLAALLLCSLGVGYAAGFFTSELRSHYQPGTAAETILGIHLANIGVITLTLDNEDRPSKQRDLLESALLHAATESASLVRQNPGLYLELTPNLRVGVDRALEYARERRLGRSAVDALESLRAVFSPSPDV